MFSEKKSVSLGDNEIETIQICFYIQYIDEKNVKNYNNSFSLFLRKFWIKFNNYYININLLHISKIVQ